MMEWLDLLRGNPVPWLLEPENPSVRYGTLRDLVGRPAGDPEVPAARAAIPSFPPVAELLSAQKRDGYWVKRDYYLPKFRGTFWVLSALADLGLTAEEEPIRRGCEYMFTFQREHGGFCRRRRVQGRGVVWSDQPGPCTHARIVRFLLQFGYGDDPRTRAAVAWLLSAQRADGMWDCGPLGRTGCLRATLDTLRAAVLDPEMAAHPAIARGAAVVADLLLERRMSRYRVKEMWTVLQYPYLGYSVISALDALGRLGYTLEHPRIARAMEYLLSRQLPEGSWPLDNVVSRPPFDVGRPGAPNKYLTLDALRVVKLFCGWDEGAEDKQQGDAMVARTEEHGEQLRAVLRKFQDGYSRRDVETLDSFMELFMPDEGVEVIGTGAIFQGRDGWCLGREAVRQLVEWDWKYWGDLALDVDGASIHVRGDVAWLAAYGTITETESSEDRREGEPDRVRHALEGEITAGEKLLTIIGEGSSIMYEVRQGEPYVWPLRFTAVLVRKEGRWRFHQMQFSFATTRMPDVHLTGAED